MKTFPPVEEKNGRRLREGTGIAAISCTGVTKVFPVIETGRAWRVLLGGGSNGKSVTALHQITLDVPKGKIVGLIGRNGAGKSTLLRVLGGVYEPTCGSVLGSGDAHGLFELGAAANPMQTGREYARRSLTLQGADGPRLKEFVEEVCDFAELGPYFDRPIYTYSTGMTTRLFFSTATAFQHDVYLIDEALSTGDEYFQNKCWRRMRQRLAGGSSGVLATHDWTAVLKLCEEAHIMDRGCIIESGAAEEIVRSYLGLASPELGAEIRFEGNLPDCAFGRSGEDFEFWFQVEMSKKKPVFFGYSVEYLKAGIGWEILLLCDNLPLPSDAGRHRVCLEIPRLPLAPGRYHLNLFLTSPIKEGDRQADKIYDSRSWIYGRSVQLVVEGTQHSSVGVLPLVWERRA